MVVLVALPIKPPANSYPDTSAVEERPDMELEEDIPAMPPVTSSSDLTMPVTVTLRTVDDWI